MDANKLKLLERLRKSEAIYVLVSGYTRMPYVVCDEETFDDEVFLFFSEETAKKEAERLIREGNPVHVVKVEQRSFLDFYTSLFPIGVNCLRIERGTAGETTIQHSDLVQRGDASKLPDGKVRIENPELHLTALYFIQEFRKTETPEMSEELAEVYEEMRVHFGRGQYIVASEEGKGIPMLKQQEGKVFLPIFTDFQEFRKGKLEFVDKGKAEGKVMYFELTEELEEQVQKCMREIEELLEQSEIPKVLHKPQCKKCAYYEYCYI